MSDPVERADALDVREARAGGPDALVASLVSGLGNLRSIVKVLAVSLALDIMLSIVVTALFFVSRSTEQRSVSNQDSIVANQHAQAVYNWNLCQRSVMNTKKLNTTTNAQIAFLSRFIATAPKPADLKAWIAVYERAILAVPECGPRP